MEVRLEHISKKYGSKYALRDFTATPEKRSVMDGHYGTISGTSYQNSTSPATLYTSSSMSKNPDSARFVISVDYNDGISNLTSLSQASAHGITSFTYTFPIYFTFDAIPNMAYVSHSVQNGTTYDGDYCYTSARLYISELYFENGRSIMFLPFFGETL